ncbi:hypothetical protein GOQ04_14935 [Emticicia sp. ODNR4P]|nr:hypothetical protein [Emticicia sp. ODNR4P]
MNDKVLYRIKETFSKIGHITGNEVIKIINSIIDEVPDRVIEAQRYVDDCHKDIGFCGSPEYNDKKAILDAYYEPIRKRKELVAEIAEYERLKEKFG